MMPRQFLIVWITALIFCAGFFTFLVTTVLSNPVRQVEILSVEPNVPTPEYVIIGSSLTGAAFPPIPDRDDVPWTGSTQRWHVEGITDWILLGMIDAAIAQDVYVVLAEAGPLVRLPPSSQIMISKKIVEFSRLARRGLIEVLGENTFHVDQSALLAESQFVDTAFETGQPRPAQISWGLRSSWSRASSTTWLQGISHDAVNIVLIGFPRSNSSISFSQNNEFALRDQELQYAQNLDLPYFETDVFWDDKFFADASHLNAAGRARYLSEFRTWWGAR